MADINLNIALSIQEATKSIQNFSATAEKSFEKVIKSSDKTSESLSGIEKSVSIIGQATSVAIGTLMVKAFDAALGAAGALFNTFITDGISAFKEQEDAIVKLNSALAAQGDLSKESQQALLNQAAALQQLTKFGDETIISVQALITNLTDLDVNGIQKATVATLNFASALGVDAETAATVISKALEGNVGALKRYGIAVKEGATEAETLNNVLGALQQRFGTASTDAVQTFSGSMALLKNAFGDLQEETGALIAQNPVIISAIAELGKIINFVKDIFIANRQPISDFVSELVLIAVQGVPLVVKGIAFLDTVLTNTAGVFKTFVGTIAIGIGTLTGESEAYIQAIQEELVAETTVRDGQLAKRQEVYSEIAKMSDESIAKIQANADKEIEIANTKFQGEEESYAIKAALEEERNATEEAKRQERLAKEVTDLMAHNENLKAIDANRYATQIAANDAQIAKTTAQLQAGSNKQIEIERKLTEMKRAELNARLNQSQTFFGNLATLTQTGNKDLFAIGKVAALAQASIATAQAVLNALAVPPYPVGLALAISAGIAGAVQIAKISSTNLATGITEVPPGFKGDSFPANLTSGERVVSVNQNMDLKSFMEENQGSKSILLSIADKLDAALIRPIIVEIEGKAVFTAVNDQLQGGRAFAV